MTGRSPASSPLEPYHSNQGRLGRRRWALHRMLMLGGVGAGALMKGASMLHAAEGAPVAAGAEAWMAKGDVHDVKLEAKAALQAYQEAEKLEPKNAELMLRMARQYRHLMADVSDKGERMRLGNMALEYGRRAAAYGPRNSDAQLSTAISYGKMLPMMSSKTQLESSKQIKLSVDRALALNRDNDLAWHILGRWHRGMAEIGTVKRTLASMVYDQQLPESTYQDSVKCFQTAIKLNSKRLMHYVELGMTYHAMERKDDAKKYLNHGLGMPTVEKDDAELKRKGRELLAKI